MRSLKTLPVLALAATACVESAEAPKLIPQAEVSYGAKLFLADETREVALSPARCTRFGTARIETSTTSSTATTVIVTATDGKTDAIDPLVPFNCYVPVAPKTLKVDVVETPNALFQFCLDTGICKTPNPADASKDQLCASEELFDDCPVVEVPQQQASNYCAFIGRRLPTVFEQLAMRQGNVTDPATLKIYPTGATTPETCADAVLKTAGCNTAKPTPLSLGDNPAGAAARDTITGSDGKKIYDLMGNVAEWSQDLFPIQRGNAASYPWFCIAALPDLNNDGVPGSDLPHRGQVRLRRIPAGGTALRRPPGVCDHQRQLLRRNRLLGRRQLQGRAGPQQRGHLRPPHRGRSPRPAGHRPGQGVRHPLRRRPGQQKRHDRGAILRAPRDPTRALSPKLPAAHSVPSDRLAASTLASLLPKNA
ncbi:MAG: SUMF1/EgtB/PvdO family nonheme iron enzyme [Deltaproteobacteria bacterium]|nr:SUMF1/EgtB/PvdO family nonheme iron enzyme [Deltaproteobacteria bacterium]